MACHSLNWCSVHPETPSMKAFLCGCVDVVVSGHEAHDMFLEDAGAQLPDTGRHGYWSEM